MKYLNNLTNLAIIRTARDYHKMVAVALSFLKRINGRDVVFHILHIGGNVTTIFVLISSGYLLWLVSLTSSEGTIRSCQKSAIKYGDTELNSLYSKEVTKYKEKASIGEQAA